MVETPSGKLTHLAALVYIVTHESEEYGQMAIYLRLNKLTPPTSDDVKGALYVTVDFSAPEVIPVVPSLAAR